MKTSGSTMHRGIIRAAVPALALALALAGCAGHYGSIRWDNGVERLFSAAQVLPGHRYYTTGPDYAPDAILALRDDSPHGAVVLDETGTRIGAWCSYRRPVPMKILGDGGVIVSPPIGEMDETPFPRGFGTD